MSQDEVRAESPQLQPPTRIWRLQYGPCWCNSSPTESSSFDYVRLRRTPGNFGTMTKNLLIVSERVIDGSAGMYREAYSSVPDPKMVVATGTCPTSTRFWDDLPNGWIPVEEVLPIDVRVEECVSGRPEALLAAILDHLFALQAPALEPAQSEVAGSFPLRQTLEVHNA